MLVFISAIKHPHNSADYNRVEELLHQTVKNLCDQTVDSFKLVIVCNQIPSWQKEFDGVVHFVKCHMSPITNVKSNRVGLDIGHLDKGIKLACAIHYAQKFDPKYVMVFDGDDFVSNEVAAYVDNHEGNGWYVKYGFVFDHSTNGLKESQSFQNICGTSAIIRNDLFFKKNSHVQVCQRLVSFGWNRDYMIHLIKKMCKPLIRFGLWSHEQTRAYHMIKVNRKHTNFIALADRFERYDDVLREALLTELDNNFIRDILGNHQFLWEYYNLKTLPFPGAIWNVNNGENMYANGKEAAESEVDFSQISRLKGFEKVGDA